MILQSVIARAANAPVKAAKTSSHSFQLSGLGERNFRGFAPMFCASDGGTFGALGRQAFLNPGVNPFVELKRHVDL
jgi:hypothetical protein